MPQYPQHKQHTRYKEAPRHTEIAQPSPKKRAKCPICVPKTGRQIGHSSVKVRSRRFHVPRRTSGEGRPDHRQGVGVGGGIGACADGLKKEQKEKAAHPNPVKDWSERP